MAVTGMQKSSKRDSVILVFHIIAVHHSLRIIQEMETGMVLIDWFKMQYLAKNADKAVFESDLVKLKQETRFTTNNLLAKEETNFHMCRVRAFHYLPKKVIMFLVCWESL